MTISYNWLHKYLPVKIDPDKLSSILTSVGLEVESMHSYDSIKGGLQGIVTAEVIACDKHPDADKLKVTTVHVGSGENLQIVCGAANVTAGQKVIVALPGATLYPSDGEPFTIKKAKIRGIESSGMICAEDEIGIGNSHEGIMVLDASTIPGKPAGELFHNYNDIIYEIGLTPNRMDAMSHRGTAKDVMAWLTYHEGTEPNLNPEGTGITEISGSNPFKIEIQNPDGCKRYCGAYMTGIEVKESPQELKDQLKAIGVKPINNIVDITNYILHDTGQPLHAFDAQQINGNKVVVRNAEEGSSFTALDGRVFKLSAEDLMICDAEKPMCIAGVYGGKNSGVTTGTKDIFLESAWFSPTNIRRTSVRHGLRTDAATRFEKGVDISKTLDVLNQAALMIQKYAGGKLQGEILDISSGNQLQKQVSLSFAYLKKLSGKTYQRNDVINILKNLGFTISKESEDELSLMVPFSKPDIGHAADIVEEIMRIDGLDNVEIPSTISISPSVETNQLTYKMKEKVATMLTGAGFFEIFTNSITNSKYYDDKALASSVRMINNLSADLDIMRPEMLQTGLEVVAYNINRKNADLRLFEFGKTYSTANIGAYSEAQHLSVFITGRSVMPSWNQTAVKSNLYYLKGIINAILRMLGLPEPVFEETENGLQFKTKNMTIGTVENLPTETLQKFSIKEPVIYADIDWDLAISLAPKNEVKFKEISKFPAVERDLAIVVDSGLKYSSIGEAIRKAKVQALKSTKLFDVFESEKLGKDKKSLAVNFVFADETKTLTDAETEQFMQKIIQSLQSNLNAEIRK